MLKKFFVMVFVFLLAGCTLKREVPLWKSAPSENERKENAPTVAVLLPLSGESQNVGKSMKNAVLLKTFDNPQTPLKVLFFDTQSTADGAVSAYHWAVAQKPDIVIGPVFSREVQAIQKAGISSPMLTFTSDTTLMNSKTGTMAVTIAEQVRSMVRNACSTGKLRLGVLAPDSKTGEIAMNALAEEVKTCPGMTLPKVSVYESNTTNFTKAVQQIVPPLINPKKKDLTEEEKAELARSMAERAKIDAIILFEEGVKLRQLLSLLAFYDAGPKDITVYALTVIKQATDTNANFVYFADLDETGYANFARQYYATFGEKPIRIASQIYDAMGLVLEEAKANRPITLDALQTRDGYWGVDGLIRLNSDGTNRRALQLKQKRGQRSILIEAASAFDETSSNFDEASSNQDYWNDVTRSEAELAD